MMKKNIFLHIRILVLLCCLLQTAGFAVYGQDRPRAAAKRSQLSTNDTLPTLRGQQLRPIQVSDTLEWEEAPLDIDSLQLENKKRLQELSATPELDAPEVSTDSLKKALETEQFIPNPTKATWLALVIPGGGQIYNRKYWKLPIFYGGFAGCAYALTWNNKMYKDYMQAYKDMKNIGRDASSVQDLLPPGYSISDSQLTELLRKRKDTYRRFRDLSIFAFVGVYLLSVVDAYVDAELSNFEIGPDLSMRVNPAVFDDRKIIGNTKQSVGVQCSFSF